MIKNELIHNMYSPLKKMPDPRENIQYAKAISDDEWNKIITTWATAPRYTIGTYNESSTKIPSRSKKSQATRKTRQYDDRQIKQLTKKNIWGERHKYDKKSRRLFNQCTKNLLDKS